MTKVFMAIDIMINITEPIFDATSNSSGLSSNVGATYREFSEEFKCW